MSGIPPRTSFQPWKIFLVETSLKYARDYLEAANVALTISLDYATIKEWYYLVKEQEKFPEDGQLQDNANDDEGGERFLIGGLEWVKRRLWICPLFTRKKGIQLTGNGN